MKKDVARDSIESSFKPIRTSRKDSLEDRNSQYNQTQKALEKYRNHAKTYKMNVAEVSEDYNMYKASRLSARNTIKASTEALVTREARSISPYHNYGKSLNTTLTE